MITTWFILHSAFPVNPSEPITSKNQNIHLRVSFRLCYLSVELRTRSSSGILSYLPRSGSSYLMHGVGFLPQLYYGRCNPRKPHGTLSSQLPCDPGLQHNIPTPLSGASPRSSFVDPHLGRNDKGELALRESSQDIAPVLRSPKGVLSHKQRCGGLPLLMCTEI